VIGLSAITLKNPYYRTLADAAVTEANQHGHRIVLASADLDVKTQIKQVDDFVEQDVLAIILIPCDGKAIGPAIRRANAAEIPVFTMDIRCTAADAKVVSHVVTDNLLGGKQAAQAMIEALGKKGGEVAILDFKSAEACQLRTRGFFIEIANHNSRTNGGEIKVVAHLDGGGMKERGWRAAQAAIRAHPNLRGIFAINDRSALGASSALISAGLAEQVSIIGFDGQLEGRQAIKRGIIYADPMQQPGRIGITTIQTVIKHLRKETVMSEILIPTELYRKANADRDPQLR
jgi:ribose transport system substrate-binding protein